MPSKNGGESKRAGTTKGLKGTSTKDLDLEGFGRVFSQLLPLLRGGESFKNEV